MNGRISLFLATSCLGALLVSRSLLAAQEASVAPQDIARPVAPVAVAGVHTATAVDGSVSATSSQFVFFGNAPMMPFGPGMSVIGGGGSVPGQTLVDKPMSAELITEFVQVLQDGNRIVNTNRSRMVRDSQGRTRIEHALDAIGESDASVGGGMVMIDDPVKQKSYTLEPVGRVAIELPRFSFSTVPNAGDGVVNAVTPVGEEVMALRDKQVSPNVIAGVAGGMFRTALPLGATTRSVQATRGDVDTAVTHRQEALGEQRIEGVLAKGIRQVETIPAGVIGNELPIESVMETWHAEAIGMPVLIRHVDPRMGEVTRRTTNLSLDEPDPELFVVPADYTIQPLPAAPARIAR